MYGLTKALIRYYQPHLFFYPERYCVAFLEKHVKGKRLLDVGCGRGWLSLAFARRGYQVVSLDVAKNCCLETKHGFRFLGLDEYGIVQASITDIPFRSNSFDTVICISVLEHINDTVKALCELNRVLVLGGHLIVLVPNKLTFSRFYDRFLYKYLPAQVIARKAYRAMYGLNINEVPIGHTQEFSVHEVATFFAKNGFRLLHYFKHRFLGPYIRSLTNFIGIPPANLVERFDLKVAQKIPYFLASEFLFCFEKIK